MLKMTTYTCRTYYLDDRDPFDYTKSGFLEPPKPPRFAFLTDVCLRTQLPGLHKVLEAPHQVLFAYLSYILDWKLCFASLPVWSGAKLFRHIPRHGFHSSRTVGGNKGCKRWVCRSNLATFSPLFNFKGTPAILFDPWFGLADAMTL